MHAVLILVIFSLFSGILPQNVAQAHTVKAEDYRFPFQDPWIASICSAAVMFKGEGVERIQLELRPDRKKVKFLENRNRLSINLFEQKKKTAPLVFILSGTGGTAFSAGVLLTGQQMFDLGYHVVTLPSTMNYQYALSVSGTGAPGYVPNDKKEYYNLLKTITDQLIITKGMQIQNYSIMGYSLGGLMAAFLLDEDANEQFFKFKRLVLINPAVDIGYAIDVLDKAHDAGFRISEGRKEAINSVIFGVGHDVLLHGFDIKKIVKAVETLNLTMDERQWLVGYNFRKDLGDVVLASQQINDLNILKSNISHFEMNGRLEEARTISFKQYMSDIVFPNLNMGTVALKTLVEQSNLLSLRKLQHNKNIYIFSNVDDYIHRPEDIQFMNDLVGNDRFYLYPHGGHVGNLWYPKNRADLESVMKFK